MLVISEELDELFEICDRIAVLSARPAVARRTAARDTSVERDRPADGRRRAAPSGTTRPDHGAPARSSRAPQPSRLMRLARRCSPLAADRWSAACPLFALLGKDPLARLGVFFIEPLTRSTASGELAAEGDAADADARSGLAVGFRANVWNIGAEGQFTMGAICGGGVALPSATPRAAWLLPAMLLAGVAGGMAWAAIPALLRTRFNTSEILVSLMLIYVAAAAAGYLVTALAGSRGPQLSRRPRRSADAALFPPLIEGTRVNRRHPAHARGGRCSRGCCSDAASWASSIRVSGLAPGGGALRRLQRSARRLDRPAAQRRDAGLAGICEVAGPIGQLQPVISPGYGFAAIIVAFVGRLHPSASCSAALLMSLLYLGGEAVQMSLNVPASLSRSFPGHAAVLPAGGGCVHPVPAAREAGASAWQHLHRGHR